jgi:flagellar hook-associated protein FlgK
MEPWIIYALLGGLVVAVVSAASALAKGLDNIDKRLDAIRNTLTNEIVRRWDR